MLFENDKCPVCNRVFQEGDDIVVCPECGTPHHRECYNQLHHCANQSLHSEDFKFQRSADTQVEDEQNKNENQNQGDVPPVSTFFNKIEAAEEQQVDKVVSETVHTEKPNEATVDGVSVYDASQVIGNNVNYYLPRFITKKGLNWNWGAFFFGPYYFFYRKMYAQGFMFLALRYFANLILGSIYSKQVTTFVNSYNALLSNGYPSADDMTKFVNSSAYQNAVPYMLIMGAIFAVFAIVIGICANRMYRKKVVTTVKAVDEKLKNGDSFTVNSVSPMMMGQDMDLSQSEMRKLFLAKQGGVSWFAPAAIYILLMIISNIM